MNESIKLTAISHIGNSRDNQEDSFLLCQGVTLPLDIRIEMGKTRKPYCVSRNVLSDGILACVSDGMGGHASGEVASRIVTEYLAGNTQRLVELAALGEGYIARDITGLNAYVYGVSKSNAEYHGMGATLCGVVGGGGSYYGFSAGDSRLYHYFGGKLTQLSKDHNEGQRLIDLKLLSEEECALFPRRKHLYKYMGYSGELTPDVFRIGRCVPGTVLLLCSDGLTDVMSDAEIESALAGGESIEKKGSALVTEAAGRNAGHGDNITLVLIEF